jgi:hypothetical protein
MREPMAHHLVEGPLLHRQRPATRQECGPRQTQVPGSPRARLAPHRPVALAAGPMLFSVLWTACTAASPVTASLKDLTVPAMVGPARPGPQRTPAAEPIDAEIRNSYVDSPMVMRPGRESKDSPEALGWAVHKAAPQCTQCTVAISRVRVGSYTTILPVDLFFWYSKNWSGVEASVYDLKPGMPTGIADNGTERR